MLVPVTVVSIVHSILMKLGRVVFVGKNRGGTSLDWLLPPHSFIGNFSVENASSPAQFIWQFMVFHQMPTCAFIGPRIDSDWRVCMDGCVNATWKHKQHFAHNHYTDVKPPHFWPFSAVFFHLARWSLILLPSAWYQPKLEERGYG